MEKKEVVHRRDPIRCFPWMVCGVTSAMANSNNRFDWKGVNCGNCLKSKPRKRTKRGGGR